MNCLLRAANEYLTYEIAAGEEVAEELGESHSACYCALEVRQDLCEFAETTQPGHHPALPPKPRRG